MKKLFIAASFVMATLLNVNAQDGFESKNGHQVLPEEGDWGIAIDAGPVIRFLGNTFSGTATNNFGTTNYATTPFALGAVPAVTGRKMLDATTAIRARFGVALISASAKTNVEAIPATTPTTYVENEVKTKSSSFYLSAGLEKRKGNHRIQGIYGAELVLALIADANTTYTYGNAISVNNQVASRLTEEKVGNTFLVGPRGFVGVEYFFAPKLSLGGEFGYGIFFSRTGGSETTSEGWDAGTSTVTTTTTPSITTGGAGQGFSGFSTDNLGGSITLNFFF